VKQRRPAGLGLLLCVLAALVPPQAAAQDLLPFSAEERAQIAAHGPWPPPAEIDASNAVQRRPAAVAWGRQLFAERRLSADGRLSCADCHAPRRAFQGAGPVPWPRAEGPAGLRNTPSLLDVSGQRWFGWDGAKDSLWAASLAPLLAADEMGWTVPALAAQVRARAGWAARFRQIWGRSPPPDDAAVVVGVAKVLAAYQATLQSPRTPFDAFRDALLRGDERGASRYPLAAQRGLKLFIGRGRCAVCHAGPRFSNGEFADIGRPFFVPSGVDPGRHGGLQQVMASRWNRLGPFNDAGPDDPRAVPTGHLLIEPRHFGEFRVPGLRQLAHTAPYMHDGSLASIEDVVRHYSALDEERLHADGQLILRRLDLSAQESADLAAFLRSLSR
jgi:cytochrome c peroxidase